MLAAGDLRHRVEIKTRAAGQDSFGQPDGAWSTAATVWADVRFLPGLKSIASGESAALSRCSVRVRWRIGIDPGMRVHHGDRVYQVLKVHPDMVGREYVDLECEAINVDV